MKSFKYWFLESADYSYPDWDNLDYKYSVDGNGDNRLDFDGWSS